jgi:G:T/U-mismatch repair DNA glycosylase
MCEVESHPFEPFLPEGARLLMLGTFPPAAKRWSMKFYYPNFTNDMWRIVGLCFFGDPLHFVESDGKHYRLEALKAFLSRQGIALYDTCTRIVRTKNTASDKDLQVVEQTDIPAMLRQLPCCQTIVTAGQLATTLCCRQFGIAEPKVGTGVCFDFEGRQTTLFRMPSSSRAYPMPIAKKAEAYQQVFDLLHSDRHISIPQ